MSSHLEVPLDEGLLDEIASRLSLRAPNAEALRAVADELDAAAGEPINVVCDLATAVGKTYLAGGLIDYLAAQGVRNVLVVTPGRTILDKTVANFTQGHPSSLVGGMACTPLVVTADNFNTGHVGSALGNDSEVKLYVFNVQQLLRPTDKVSRRTRKHQEWLGADLYEHLRSAGDVVVIADECHVYTERAKAFYAAVNDLDAMATVGLTATPSPEDVKRRIYHYPLARAIADRYVKTPVLVGRKDDANDVETRLRDGLRLLEAKQKAADAWVAASGGRPVNAVMFVVADTIDNADAVTEILNKPGLLGDQPEAVLTIHSQSNDDALTALAAVEEPDSPVRVIVSVSMLKEGWDVKNIFVICSLRPSISDALTEQTLGRGLRLPWGEYTGVQLLDTVEVVSHERYRQLLERADVLLEGLVETRGNAPDDGSTPTEDDAASVGDGAESSGPVDTDTAGAVGATDTGATSDDTDTGVVEPGEPKVEETEGYIQHSERAADALRTVEPTKKLMLPRVTVRLVAQPFELSSVEEDAFERLGRQMADAGGGDLTRKVLAVEYDTTAPHGIRVVPSEAEDVIEGVAPQLPFDGAEAALAANICGLDIVVEDQVNLNGAKRLAAAVVRGAGGPHLIAAYLSTATDIARHLIREAYRATPAQQERSVTSAEFGPVRITDRTVEPNRYKRFSKRAAYSGWRRGQYPLEWFDSGTERDFANLIDEDAEVDVWTRLHTGELTIAWSHRSYNPDFYVLAGGVHHLLEVKADRHLGDDDVTAKAKAAREWGRYVTDHGTYGTWTYLVVPETVVKNARSFRAAVTQATNTK